MFSFLSLDFCRFSGDDGVMVLSIVLALFCSICTNALGQRSVTRYYHYDGKPIFLQSASFSRYVVPQLKNMLRDYERLLQKLGPEHEGLIVIRRKAVELIRGWEKVGEECAQQFSEDCRIKYRDIYVMGRNVERMVLSFQNEKVVLEGANVDGMMALSIGLGELQRTSASINYYLEKGIIFGGSEYYDHQYFVAKINPLVKDIKFFSNMVMTGFLSKEDKAIFDFVWDNFFSQLDDYVISKRDKEYLLRRLEELNIYWHTFHMKMTKGFRKYPKSIDVACSNLNKRWNSILKIILQTKKGGR